MKEKRTCKNENLGEINKDCRATKVTMRRKGQQKTEKTAVTRHSPYERKELETLNNSVWCIVYNLTNSEKHQ